MASLGWPWIFLAPSMQEFLLNLCRPFGSAFANLSEASQNAPASQDRPFV